MQQYLHSNCHQQQKVMNNRLYLPAILLLLTFSACTKDDMQPANGDKLQRAILAGNPDDVETEINKVCASISQSADSENALNDLSNAIISQCKVNAAILCYNCISTLPAQSEIKISINYQGFQKNKVIDITKSGNRFLFAGMHD